MNGFSNPFDAEDIIDGLREKDDEHIHLAESALALANLTIPDRSAERYVQHLNKMSQEVGERYSDLIESGSADDGATKLAAIKHILYDKYGYDGDRDHYDHLQNANLMQVIDRRKGMPIALSILCIHVGRVNGWSVKALNFPAHVVCRIEDQGEIHLFDPFNQCKLLDAANLRSYLKTLVSPNAELSSAHYNIATNRQLLIRLQNNIKLRQIEAEDYDSAIATIETMRKVAPDEYGLLFDSGVIYARLGKPLAALRVLETYMEKAISEEDKDDAFYLIEQIRKMLN